MPYTVIPTVVFEKDIEHYQKQGFASILDDIDNDVVSKIRDGHLVGEKVAEMSLPEHHFVIKARACNSDANVGKSNGYRVIYYAIKEDNTIYLLTVYYKKKDRDVPSNKTIREIVKSYCI